MTPRPISAKSGKVFREFFPIRYFLLYLLHVNGGQTLSKMAVICQEMWNDSIEKDKKADNCASLPSRWKLGIQEHLLYLFNHPH